MFGGFGEIIGAYRRTKQRREGGQIMMFEGGTNWRPIGSAPKDGSPVWARWRRYDNDSLRTCEMVYGWVYCDNADDPWARAGTPKEWVYPTEWLPGAGR